MLKMVAQQFVNISFNNYFMRLSLGSALAAGTMALTGASSLSCGAASSPAATSTEVLSQSPDQKNLFNQALEGKFSACLADGVQIVVDNQKIGEVCSGIVNECQQIVAANPSINTSYSAFSDLDEIVRSCRTTVDNDKCIDGNRNKITALEARMVKYEDEVLPDAMKAFEACRGRVLDCVDLSFVDISHQHCSIIAPSPARP